MLHMIEHALKHTLTLLPFLYVTYLAMEVLEHKLQNRSGRWVRKAGKLGPLAGGLVGILPQCGFSTVAANLYAGRIISVGTLLAVFLSTSDEMLPLLISYQTPPVKMVQILALKAAIGIAAGFLVDLLLRRRKQPEDIGHLCEHEHCHCHQGNLFLSALRHTISIGLFLLIISIILEVVLHEVGEDTLYNVLQGNSILTVVLSAIVGLIPNCAASVTITTLYLDGLLSFGAMMAGLLVGAGMGLLVLLRMNRDWKDNLRIIGLLLAVGIVCGIALDGLSIAL